MIMFPLDGKRILSFETWGFDGKTFSDFRIGPRLGQHTYEILESLGHDEEEIQELNEKQIIIISRRDGKDR